MANRRAADDKKQILSLLMYVKNYRDHWCFKTVVFVLNSAAMPSVHLTILTITEIMTFLYIPTHNNSNKHIDNAR